MSWTFHIVQKSALSDEEQLKFYRGGTGIYRSSGFGSKIEALEQLAIASPHLPLGFQIMIEKRYHPNRGYEPRAAFRLGDVGETWYFTLIDHGAWYDPKTDRARPPKWKLTDHVKEKP